MTDEAQALEMARCSYINLNNMVEMMPTLKMHPLLPLVKRQMQECIKALGDEDFCELHDRED